MNLLKFLKKKPSNEDIKAEQESGNTISRHNSDTNFIQKRKKEKKKKIHGPKNPKKFCKCCYWWPEKKEEEEEIPIKKHHSCNSVISSENNNNNLLEGIETKKERKWDSATVSEFNTSGISDGSSSSSDTPPVSIDGIIGIDNSILRALGKYKSEKGYTWYVCTKCVVNLGGRLKSTMMDWDSMADNEIQSELKRNGFRFS